ncbi:GlxA family transcriptional regulator [Kitasatospora sp. NPDC094019]|uniref:GlxA family transcriptional regulator n=1 Tax=Kitasatospora sp. NPDC094019 TaxID=3364091 RepID=UPI0038035F26
MTRPDPTPSDVTPSDVTPPDHADQDPPGRVAFLVFDELTLLDLSGPLEVFHQAGALGLPYPTVLVSPRGGTVTASNGVTLAGTVAPAGTGPLDTLVIAGADHLATRGPDPELLAAAGALVARARRVATVCSGAFVPAALGLLDGRRATTHWRHAAALARRHPGVRVEPDALHVRDGRFHTGAGISAGIDLALALVEDDHGADIARDIARELVVFMRRPGGQSQFSTAAATPPARGELLRAVTEAVRADPAADHGLPAMAATAAVSTRHLTRLFRAELGTTPARWVERVRLDRAQQLLLEGHSVTSAARRSGLGSDESLRRAFAHHLGTTPSDYRRRFGTAQLPAR